MKHLLHKPTLTVAVPQTQLQFSLYATVKRGQLWTFDCLQQTSNQAHAESWQHWEKHTKQWNELLYSLNTNQTEPEPITMLDSFILYQLINICSCADQNVKNTNLTIQKNELF